MSHKVFTPRKFAAATKSITSIPPLRSIFVLNFRFRRVVLEWGILSVHFCVNYVRQGEQGYNIQTRQALYINGALRKGDLYELGSLPKPFCSFYRFSNICFLNKVKQLGNYEIWRVSLTGREFMYLAMTVINATATSEGHNWLHIITTWDL